MCELSKREECYERSEPVRKKKDPEFRVIEPKPPVIVVDEYLLRTSYDVGPICECKERYEAVMSYEPFLPGGTMPFNRVTIPDDECFEVAWWRRNLEPHNRNHMKPTAFLKKDIPSKYYFTNQTLRDLMYLRPEEYFPRTEAQKPREEVNPPETGRCQGC